MVAMTMADDLGIMTHDGGTVVHLGVALLTLGDELLHALLDVGGVHDGVILLVALLSLVLDWLLVALFVGLAEALEVVVRSVPISRLGLSLDMAHRMTSTSVTTVDDLRVVTNNSGAVVHLLAGLLAVLGHDVLALLDVGRVHDGVILRVAPLLGVAVLLLVAVLVVAAAGGSEGGGGQGEDEAEADHGEAEENLFPAVVRNRS